MRTVDVGEGLNAFRVINESPSVDEFFNTTVTVAENHPDPSWTTTMSGTFTESQLNPTPTLNQILNSQRTTNNR
jgi:hypothetical protein